jgi:hypothetical protein
MGCLATAKMSMLMDILKASNSPEATLSGNWEIVQDPESGEVLRTWVDDDPSTTNVVEGDVISAVPCIARAVLGSGLNNVGNTEKFEDVYTNIEWVKMQVPAGTSITKRDRVTRIRDLKGNLVWKDEERDDSPATVFNVMGVTPIMGPFNNVIEYLVLLKRADVQ